MLSDKAFTPAITHIVIGLIRNPQRRILVGVRPAGQVLAGQAEFPGGKVKPNEDLEAALRREVLEETGLAIQNPLLREVIDHTYPHGQLKLHFFDCEIVDSASDRLVEPWQWVEVETLDPSQFPIANASVIAALKAEVSQQSS